jgi:hypothetical protein
LDCLTFQRGPSWSWSYWQIPIQSVSITTNVVSSNLAHGEMYSIQHYLIKFVSDLRQSEVFSRYSSFLHQQNWPPRYNCNIVESDVHHNNPNPFVFTPVRFVRSRALLMLFAFIYAYWCPTLCPYQMIRQVSLVEHKLLTLPEHPSAPPGF